MIRLHGYRLEMNNLTVVTTDRFRHLVESIQDYGIFMLDADGLVISWNIGAQRIKQYQAQDVIGKHFSLFYPPDAIAVGWPQEELRRAREFGRYEDEGWRIRKDGSRFWANVVITAMVDASGELTGYGKVTRDMTERRRLEELEQSSQRMNEFLAMLAHELRNPLAPIRNAVSILQLEPTPSAAVKSGRDVIDRQLSQLTRLVDDLLDAGRLTSGKIILKTEMLEYTDVVEKCMEAVRPLAQVRQHRLTVNLPQDRLRVLGDSVRLTQVLQNLMINAIKFTPEGGNILLKVWAEGHDLHTAITDSGVGLTPQALDRIFTLFVQVDGAAAGQSGLGIGLTLAKSLVELHGGTLHASSAGPNFGSTFSFVLPGALEAPALGQADRNAEKLMLVCDDNRDAADTLSEVLRLLGYQVVTAYDGAGAETAMRAVSPSALFLDLSMPDTTGYELLKKLRDISGTHRTPAFAISGFGNEEHRRRTQAAGFSSHLTKPVALDRLRQALAEADLA